jgi:hypothetical protein
MAIILWLKIDDLKKMNHQQGESPIKFAERFRYVRRMSELAQAVSAGDVFRKSPAKPPCCENATWQCRDFFCCLEMKILESVQQASHTTRCAGMNLITAATRLKSRLPYSSSIHQALSGSTT